LRALRKPVATKLLLLSTQVSTLKDKTSTLLLQIMANATCKCTMPTAQTRAYLISILTTWSS
jgi:hypothetical protein